jgi:hypothetical protein
MADSDFNKQQGGKLYPLIITMCLSVLAIFSYMTYYVYTRSAGTSLVYVTYVLAIPLFVSLILFILIVVLGKDETLKQLLNQ